jgi:acetylornithine/succinyldiaminopimelate/putrescine aminotransferase
VLIEPLQGEGGVRVAPEDYFKKVRRLCDESGCLLMLDEVQTGMGRTGKLFAHEHFGIEPDVMTLAKGIAGGIPMGALLATDEVAKSLVPGTHAATFGGNPLSSAAGLYVVQEVLADRFLENVQTRGNYLRSRLEALARQHDVIREVRGLGLMQAIDLNIPCGDLVTAMRELGVLVNCTSDTVLRFLPPLIVTEDEIDQAMDALDSVLSTVEDG